MEFKIIKIKEIKKHDEFNAIYMKQLHVCAKFLTKDELKEECYCSKQCHNNCFGKQKHYSNNMFHSFETLRQCMLNV